MPLSFTPQQRLDITRRQLNIVNENAAFDSTTSKLTDEKIKLFNVDDANKVFYDAQTLRVGAYEGEARAMSGVIPATYTDGGINPYVPGDMSTSAKTPGATAAVFFPNSPIYAFLAPKIIDAVNGYNHPVGTDARYEQNILTNATVTSGLTELIFRLSNGISGGGGTTASTSIPAGPVTNFSVTVLDSSGFSPGQLVYIAGGGSGIYSINSISGPLALTIDSVIPTLTGIGGGTINGTVAAFTPTERQTLVSGSYQEILTNITNDIFSVIAEWEGKIDTQITQISVNNESRPTQIGQNAAALFDINNTKVIIDSWQALPNTGGSGKYTSGGIAPISAEITARQAFIPARLTQIVTALGSVSQTGETFSGVVGSPYYERYKWLNIRINKATGSARRYFAADDGINFLTVLSTNNTAVKNEYDLYFLTKRITAIDGTTIVQITDVVGINNGDTVTIVSETQAEIQRAVIDVMGTTQLKLDKLIPNSYVVGDDLPRLFKTL